MPKITKNTHQPKIDPKVKDVLLLLGTGTFLAASIFFPGLPMAAKPIIEIVKESQYQKRQKEWAKFNPWRLKQIVKRLQQQKLVEIIDKNGIPAVKITKQGKQKILKYNLDEIELDKTSWDGKWRIIIYDIFSKKRQERELFRKTLRHMEFFKLQRSVYLTPYPCRDQIEYLRQVLSIPSEVIIITVSGIENEIAYRQYFGLT
ncbi:hypothetical protein HYU92_05620 [Candidatus Curtissbacteria bacterium]|nr:hypothetical protein [Candidatus Curtissbacteria bacterium]